MPLGINEKSEGLENVVINNREWKNIIRTIQQQSQNENIYAHLAKLV